MASFVTDQSKYKLLWEVELTIVGKPTWSFSTPFPTQFPRFDWPVEAEVIRKSSIDVKNLSQTKQIKKEKLCQSGKSTMHTTVIRSPWHY